MTQYLTKVQEEIKRADHLLYVSLKYTRTVDVMRNVIERIINAYAFINTALLEHAKEKGKIPEVPASPIMKCDLLKQTYKEEERIVENTDFYLTLRKILKAKMTKREEYRRHITMTAFVDPANPTEVTPDNLKEYFYKIKDYLEYLEEAKLIS